MADVAPPPSGNQGPAPQEPLLPAGVQATLDRIRSVWFRLPLTIKLILAAAATTGVLVLGYFSIEPLIRDDAILFSQMDQSDAATVVEKLKAAEVPYVLTGDGTTIRVPRDRVHELRLSLAAEGLPRGGQTGFESFEKLRLGATEFEQQVVYRRAMEGELARTISTVQAVRSARIHLVMPKKSVFAQRGEPASASVVLKLTGNHLSPQEVTGIVNVVASAVAGLEPQRISVVTTDGKMLHRPKPSTDGASDAMSDAEADQMAQTRALESTLEARTRSMLERVMGPGHVDVRVRAELDTAKIERKSDTFAPEKTALRSEQMLVESAGGDRLVDTVAGVPGAEANLPGIEAGEEAVATGNGSTRRSHTRNFEIDRVQERRVSVTQSVKRLAVAVVLDGVPQTVGDTVRMVPRPREELDKLATLVRSAVGFSEDRGDEVTVESVPFYVEEVADLPPEPSLLPLPEPYRQQVEQFLPLTKLVLSIIGILIVVLMLRGRMKKWAKERDEHIQQLQAGKRTAALEAAAVASESTADIDYRTEALRRAKGDPASAALVMQHWLGTTDKSLEAA